MNEPKKISERSRGRWKSILTQLGVDERILDGQHHPCPVNGEGNDRFRFSNYRGKGNFFCACNDGRGDGFKLLECKFGAEFKEAAKMVEDIIGLTDEDEEQARTTEHAMRDLRLIQDAVKRQQDQQVVSIYLHGRGIEAKNQPVGVLRQASLNYGLRRIGITEKQITMVAKVLCPDSTPSTFHLTYLAYADGGVTKATIERSRIVATPAAPMAGGAVRLHPMGSNGVLGVAEGIETALSARILHDMVPVWATLNAHMLEQFVPPPGCTKLLIFGDNDASCTGQAASWALAKKCAIKFKIDAEVHIPLRVGKDWNDVLMRGA